MTAVIYYHPEAYSVRSDRVMGRHSAGDAFLRAMFRHSSAEELWAYVAQSAHGADWSQAAMDAEWSGRATSFGKDQLGTLSRIGALFVPGPGLCEHARKRSLWAHDAWSLVGVTHTLSSGRAMDSIIELVSGPIMPWDALICTSRVAKSVVENLLSREEEDLTRRLGATTFMRPKLPLIPLGVHVDEFTRSKETRILGRKKLGLADDELAVLFLGRLSFHAKAHPLPMYLALERAAKATGRKIVLVECGWHGNESIANAFAEAFAVACPSLRRISLHANEAEERHQIWSGADIFCSLSDNIQETFGLTPVEAMAAGLPVVVSDWDGYKDTVRHGVDGFRVPTIMPRAGLGGDLALRHALEVDTYDMYIGHACSLTAVDVEAATAAFSALFESEDLRLKMGAAGQARAREVYDWGQIIPQYEDLWEDLNEERKRAAGGTATKATWPARPDPFAAFEAYPTHILTEATQLEATGSDVVALCAQVEAMRALAMINFAKLVLPTPEEVRVILVRAIEGPARAVELVRDIAAQRRGHVFRGLGWLLKLGALRLAGQAELNLAQSTKSDAAART
jgi:starch synthase